MGHSIEYLLSAEMRLLLTAQIWFIFNNDLSFGGLSTVGLAKLSLWQFILGFVTVRSLFHTCYCWQFILGFATVLVLFHTRYF